METLSKILIIDDEPDIRKILEINLSIQKYIVLTAENGEQGIQLAKKELPGLILLDMMMPGMDGNEVCRILQQDEKTRPIPIIFLTAKETMESKLEGFESGAIDYVIKPFEMVELSARIASQFKIQKLHAEVQNYVKQIDADLDLARQVQKSILPHYVPYMKGINIATDYFASETVGGDYYDIIKLNDDELALLITDVSGHGIAASFITAMAKMAFKHSLEKNLPLNKILEDINRDFLDIIQTDHYLTAFICKYNVKTRTLNYAKAGHLNQLLYHSDSDKFTELQTSGFFIGTFADGRYEQKSVQLEEGDKLVLFTDGLTECKNSGGEPFGTKSLMSSVSAGRGLDSSSLVNQILLEQGKYIRDSDRTDDYSLLVMDINTESILEEVVTLCNFTSSSNINMEYFNSQGVFTIRLVEIINILEARGYKTKFLRELKMCMTVLFNLFSNMLEKSLDSIRIIWQDDSRHLKFIVFPCRKNSLLLKDKSQCVESLLKNDKGATQSLITKVFQKIEFYKNGNIIGLIKTKTG